MRKIGTYHTQAIVSKPLNLVGRPGAVIDAKGQPPLTIGTTKLPGSIGIGVLGTSHARVTGFKVVNAGFDAILVALSSHVLVSRNVLEHNGDVGVDLNGSSWSTAYRNVSEHNTGGGYLIADDIGPNSHNVVSYNVASKVVHASISGNHYFKVAVRVKRIVVLPDEAKVTNGPYPGYSVSSGEC